MTGGLQVDLVEHTPGAPHSGIGRYTRELVRYLAPHADVRLTTQVDPPLAGRLSVLHHLPVGVRDRRPGSIVHFMEDLGCSQMLWRPVSPSVATSYDLGMLVWPPEARMHAPVARVVWYLSYLGLRRMDAVIAISAFSGRKLVERMRVDPRRVFAIYPGIDHGIFHPRAVDRAGVLARHGLPGDSGFRYVLYVGTEAPRKNLPTLLRALRRLSPSVRLLKVGSAGNATFRARTERSLDRLGLRDRVTFIDRASDEELAALYAVADVYVNCSFLEGFGYPAVEAMACGTPVVCSDVGAVAEVTGDAALSVPPDDDAAIAAAVSTILDGGGLRDGQVDRGLGRAAKFDWARSVSQILDVYERVSDPRWRRSPSGTGA